MKSLGLLLNEASGLFKVFISSRPEDHINNLLESWSKFDVEPEFTRGDVETYVESQVDKRLMPGEKINEAEVKENFLVFFKFLNFFGERPSPWHLSQVSFQSDEPVFIPFSSLKSSRFRYIEMAVP